MLTDVQAIADAPMIVKLLVRQGTLDEAAWEPLANQPNDSTALEERLIHANLASELEIANAYSHHFMTPLLDLGDQPVELDESLASLLPLKFCRDHLLIPFESDEETLQVAFFSVDSLVLIDEIRLVTDREVRPVFATLSTVERLISLLYEQRDWVPTSKTSGFAEVDSEDEEDADPEEGVVHLDQPPPPGRDGRVIRYVNNIFEQALDSKASDIHIEPFEDMCRVRLRVDGRLSEVAPPPMTMYTAVVARIKVLAKIDIAEKRVPQDGAIALRLGERRVDLRVNTCPTSFGEKVVLRVLDKDAIPLDLTGLGLNERQQTDLVESIQSPHGLMLVTGPTGSGKSTTLYSCLQHLNQPDVNICTAEDPVEYKFVGINQVQTRAQVGLTFASTLRAFLRQDPDIIMVGEVRDGETAEICMRAALTGHFVLSTLHTNSALAAVNRLADMGIEPFLLASSLRLIIAQRLIRRLCLECREPFEVDEDTAKRFNIPPQSTLYRPVGCSQCTEGYRGRLGVFEVIRVTRGMAPLIQRNAPLEELRQRASEEGMTSLADGAMTKVVEGLTSIEEALSITVLE